MPKKFQRTIENFACKHCGYKVKGNGYTNHCPKCLWSRHVDNNPGDRKNPCGGLMEPVWLETKKNDYLITHKCLACGEQTHCKSAPEDNISALTELSESIAKKTLF